MNFRIIGSVVLALLGIFSIIEGGWGPGIIFLLSALIIFTSGNMSIGIGARDQEDAKSKSSKQKGMKDGHKGRSKNAKTAPANREAAGKTADDQRSPATTPVGDESTTTKDRGGGRVNS